MTSQYYLVLIILDTFQKAACLKPIILLARKVRTLTCLSSVSLPDLFTKFICTYSPHIHIVIHIIKSKVGLLKMQMILVESLDILPLKCLGPEVF